MEGGHGEAGFPIGQGVGPYGGEFRKQGFGGDGWPFGEFGTLAFFAFVDDVVKGAAGSRGVDVELDSTGIVEVTLVGFEGRSDGCVGDLGGAFAHAVAFRSASLSRAASSLCSLSRKRLRPSATLLEKVFSLGVAWAGPRRSSAANMGKVAAMRALVSGLPLMVLRPSANTAASRQSRCMGDRSLNSHAWPLSLTDKARIWRIMAALLSPPPLKLCVTPVSMDSQIRPVLPTPDQPASAVLAMR
ncbi:hypothetical protein [Marinomonas primoryensis]|uniref:Uncharacterized protein n=1 Tax=Marinomonas primoryensis TaxID=178399 RepID=A0ABV0KUE3_9GAMM